MSEKPGDSTSPDGYLHTGTAAGYLRDATELLLNQVRAATDMTADAGRRAMAGVNVPPTTDAATDVLSYLQGVMAQAPAPIAQLDLLAKELRAKRALINALQLQLAAFEQQLQMVEQSLQPLHAWGQQWSSVQKSLSDTLQPFVRPSLPEPDTGTDRG